jgi:predicted nucleic acid-binding protein
MAGVLVDSNVLLDVLTEDREWFVWSSEALARCADEAEIVINPIVYSEVSIGFDRIEDVEAALPGRYSFAVRCPGAPPSWPASAFSPTNAAGDKGALR